ncbi:GvpL/GvpF family gas vesicle protein [Streptomyces triculaminicus]|uniref:GvpL/GvpF family gas vesicle protein n=2 Tax=Streptomyces TaxID=1883 RepID=A0A939FR54_9ACTN|nr:MULTISPECIES: GvpL/GvpF family gas vesicle protein [Streptomyces]MBO0655764.1 GvpL/GvpF family gas vesicle protein [Streptomyces triculaminicus]QSY49790.1 GvpL/GvpF family gas vesicle protein [Streptomyces griseocarneus]
MTTYVYGIAHLGRGPLPENLTGIGDPPLPVRLVTHDDLAAVVSDCPERLRPKRRDLLAHQNVVTEVGRRAPLLPMRFGSLSDSDDRVRDVLDEHADRYREQLVRLSGRVEYNVKAVHREDAVLHLVLAENAGLRSLAAANQADGGGSYEQRLRFGELVAQGVREREGRDAELVREALAPLAERERTGPENSGCFLNVSYLIEEAAARRLLDEVRRLEKTHPQLELTVHGPLPPYSFVE